MFWTYMLHTFKCTCLRVLNKTKTCVKTGTLKNLKKLEQVMDILNKVPKNITFHFFHVLTIIFLQSSLRVIYFNHFSFETCWLFSFYILRSWRRVRQTRKWCQISNSLKNSNKIVITPINGFEMHQILHNPEIVHLKVIRLIISTILKCKI